MNLEIDKHFRKYIHAYLIACIGIFISLGLFYALQVQEEQDVVSIAQLGIETIDNQIQSELTFNASVLKHMAAYVGKGKVTQASWQSHVVEFLPNYPGIYGVAWVNSGLHIDWFALKSATIEKSFKQFLNENASRLRTTKLIWISSPFQLSNGKTGLFMILPLFTPKGPSYLISLIDTDTLFHRSTRIPAMLISVYVNHQPIYQYDPNARNKTWLFEISQYLYGAVWEMKAQEATLNLGKIHLISYEAPLSWLTLLLGVLISILLARSIALSDLLKERTIVLDTLNQQLKAEIAEHIETEESKKNLEKALLQGQKLQAIGTLAGGIAHDFNNILYAIRGYVEMAREDVSKDQMIYKNLGKVLDATHRGQDLIAQILAFSRRQHHHEFSPINIKATIESILALLRPAVPQTVDIQFKAASDIMIWGNKTQIHQVIVNLINNAVDATDGEGSIKIILDHLKMGDPLQHKFPQLKMQNYCKIDISDTGHGMDQATMERIFEPFFTTKEVGKGTGLGLSIVHSIIKDHQGEIMVNSHLGCGTTFTLFLPEYTQEGHIHG